MNLSAPFIRRPVGTVLLTLGMMLAGVLAWFQMPVAPLPSVDFPTISVEASLSGASPETMASSVATPLERQLGVIPGVTEMTSRSSTGSTQITLQFELSRDIDEAATEVQAAINAAASDLPATMVSNPTYDKRNPSDSPVMMLALTSKTKTPGEIYDAVSNIMQQRLAQVNGVGDVEIGGGSLPAIRISANPFLLNNYGLSTEDIRAALEAASANRPKGAVVSKTGQRWQLYTESLGRDAEQYQDLIIAWRSGSPVRLSDVATVENSVEDTRTLGLYNGEPAVVVLVSQEPGANVVELVDAINASLPDIRASLPEDITLSIANERTTSIRSSLHEIEITLAVALTLVILVVAGFLRSARATFIPAAATIVSLSGTVAVMWALGYSLNNLSLMAIIVATGFVVDDAIVVLENTQRHIEAGMDKFAAALLGAKEVGFTVLSISVSLVAVFIPLLFMGGQVGRLFQEFAVTLSVAVMISLVLSLTTTPMMCAWLLKSADHQKPQGRIAQAFENGFARMQRGYAHALDWALAMKPLVMLSLVLVIAGTVWLYMVVPKGYFPETNGRLLMAGVRADESVSFDSMASKLEEVITRLDEDPAVEAVVGFTGGRRSGGAFMAVNLVPEGDRDEDSFAVAERLQKSLGDITGISIFLRPRQDIRAGGRSSNSTYQYTLKSDDSEVLAEWTSKLSDQMKQSAILSDIDSDQSQNGVESFVTIDHDTASRLGITSSDVDSALYNAFGQRQVSTIYEDINQYGVILEWQPKYALRPSALGDVYVPTGNSGTATSTNPALRNSSTGSAISESGSTMVPLSQIASFGLSSAASQVNHDNGELSSTISFNLAEGATLSEAETEIAAAEDAIQMPATVRGAFAGTAQEFQDQLDQQPFLIAAALLTIYLVLGMLYESTVHPLTVLSTLPAAGVGAVIALMVTGLEFSVIALIGVFLLLGIVKKNAILIIDFALNAQRERGLSAEEAVREASLLRFRPIIMTTLAAALGVVPLAIGIGEGSELRTPLGITIIGGLIVSQILTLLTTPVVYVLLDRFAKTHPHLEDEEGAAAPASSAAHPA